MPAMHKNYNNDCLAFISYSIFHTCKHVAPVGGCYCCNRIIIIFYYIIIRTVESVLPHKSTQAFNFHTLLSYATWIRLMFVWYSIMETWMLLVLIPSPSTCNCSEPRTKHLTVHACSRDEKSKLCTGHHRPVRSHVWVQGRGGRGGPLYPTRLLLFPS